MIPNKSIPQRMKSRDLSIYRLPEPLPFFSVTQAIRADIPYSTLQKQNTYHLKPDAPACMNTSTRHRTRTLLGINLAIAYEPYSA